jgi:hypothetical protein
VLPDPLREEGGSLQKAPSRVDLLEHQVIVFDRHHAPQEKPATEKSFAWFPFGGEVGDIRREGHPQERSELAVHA